MKTLASLLVALGPCLVPAQEAVPQPPDLTAAREVLARNGALEPRVHDPSSIVRCKDEYWFFATGNGVASWRSRDLTNWVQGPRVFPEMPAWVKDVVPTQRGHFWAPDVILHEGRYRLYYSVSAFGKNTSAIALATNATLDPEDPDFAWRDEGIVVRSNAGDDFNAIDPAVIRTASGEHWMSFGSFWSGLKLFELDPASGKALQPEAPLRAIANYPEIEAPYIHQRPDHFYLFVNWDRCCRGTNSTYNIRVGRSREITGPYRDRDGRDLRDGGGTLLLATDGPFVGPGHANILEEDGRFWLSFHFYDGTDRGRSKLAIRSLRWREDGWPELPER